MDWGRSVGSVGVATRSTLVLNLQHSCRRSDGTAIVFDAENQHPRTTQPTNPHHRLKTREKPTLCVFDPLFRQSRPTLEMSMSQKYPMHFHTLIFIATTKKKGSSSSAYVGRRKGHFFLENGKLLPQKNFLGKSKFSVF